MPRPARPAPARAARPRRRRARGRPSERRGRVESPRGATVCIVERDGDRIARLRLRTGSYANWPVLARCAPGTSFRTSRSSTRASSSATPAWIADVHAPPRPAAPATRDRARRGRCAVRSPSATSTPDRATAASTSCRWPPARSTTCSGSGWASSRRPATPTCCSSPAGHDADARSAPASRTRDARAAPRGGAGRLRPRLRRARDAAEVVGRLEDVLPVDLRIAGCPPSPDEIVAGLRTLSPLQLAAQDRGGGLQLVRVGRGRRPRQPEAVVRVARNHVDVEVEDGLPGGGAGTS